MDALEMLMERHANLHGGMINDLISPLTEAELRARPAEGVNSIVWLVWHMARCEDVGVNLFVVDRHQVLQEEGWPERLGVPIAISGTGMSDEEVAELSEVVDIKGLRDYYDAVGRRTVEVVDSLTPVDLAEIMQPEDFRRILESGAFVGANADWVYGGQSRGWFLAHLGVTHNYSHFGEAFAVRGLLGVRRRPDDGTRRAAPEWELRAGRAVSGHPPTGEGP